MKRLFTVIVLVFFVFPRLAAAQEMPSRLVSGTIERIDRVYADERGYPQVEMVVRSDDGTPRRVDTGASASSGITYVLAPGDRVRLAIVGDEAGVETAYFDDAVRGVGAYGMLAAFAAATIAVGWWRGLRALAGLVATLAILFGGIIPAILSGSNPVTAAALGGLVILAASLAVTHGWRRETLGAFLSASAGLALAWMFGRWFLSGAFLSGLSSEEAAILYTEHLGPLANMPGILLAGIMLGAVGALDDVAIAQGEIVAELRAANPSLSRGELFSAAMRVGRHHIASIANTLVLAYAGAALPTLALFWSLSSVRLSDFLGTEAIAEEIARTLAGTTALILTVPISTWIAVSLDTRRKRHV